MADVGILRSFQRFPKVRYPPLRPGCAGPPPLQGRLRVLPYHFTQSKRPWGADTRYDRPKCRIYSNAAGASPGQHTIPSAILPSARSIVKHNCAKREAGLEKTLLFSTKGEDEKLPRAYGPRNDMGRRWRSFCLIWRSTKRVVNLGIGKPPDL